MPQPLVPDEDLLAALKLIADHGGNISAASRAAGMPRATLAGRQRQAALRGLLGFDPVLPGFEVKQTSAKVDGAWVKQVRESGEEFEPLPGHVVKGESALVDQDGRVRAKWVKTKQGELTPEEIADRFERAMAKFEGRGGALPAPEHQTSDRLLTLIPCNDWHVNLLTWEREVGQNWDLRIAERVLGDTAENVVLRAPPASLAIVLGGGDLLHADDNSNRTKLSGNALDVDGRHEKGLEVAQRLKVRTIDAALRHNDRVLVRILKGNHDDVSAVAVAYFLKAWYRSEPRVVVDCDPSLFFYHRFGQTFIGATHGHMAKLRDMPMLMASRRAQDWGNSVHRYAHGFHVHHRELHGWEENGVIGEAHQAPVPQDGWHYASGFISGRSMQSITYDADMGEYSRVRLAVMGPTS